MPRPIQPSDRSYSTALLCRWDEPWRLDRRWLSDERWRVCSLLGWLTDSCDYAQGGVRIRRVQPNFRGGPAPKPPGGAGLVGKVTWAPQPAFRQNKPRAP